MAIANLVVHVHHNAQPPWLDLLVLDHSGFINDRLASFVGRQKELNEIRWRIAETHSTGGYVTITGQAGQGKSSVIAKLADDTVAKMSPITSYRSIQVLIIRLACFIISWPDLF